MPQGYTSLGIVYSLLSNRKSRLYGSLFEKAFISLFLLFLESELS